MLDVGSVALKISFELGQRQIMRLQDEQPKVPPMTRVKRYEPGCIVFGNGGYGDEIEIDSTFAAKG